MEDSFPAPTSSLNARRERFVRNVVSGQFNSKGEAYVAAGYKASDGGPARDNIKAARLLRSQEVQDRIAELQEIAQKQFLVDLVEVVNEVRRIALADVASFYEVNEEGETILIPPNRWTPAQRAAVSEVSIRKLQDGQVHSRVKFHDKLRSIDMLLKMLGAYAPEKSDVTIRKEEEKKVVSLSREDLLRLEAERMGYTLVPRSDVIDGEVLDEQED